ncbi:XRE family transcriptional regulator [Aliishimia ponticola]|uniref:XRE family transcriptional regulator n=1 Tax=Aliishimia ponticola TaxID=2499833 RepID=A0A4S4N916_9RHOB|nr:helix-turn-helix transcriptional regulator [Aliishimia ponticola]THH35734.1 XRE family transcriptional regulator [Aliishimia ponticola]
MPDIIDKRARALAFRDRLSRAMVDAGTNQSALARAIGVDRSTLSQALTSDGPRLPGAQVIAACATALGVSADWLLSLSDRPESAQDIAASSLGLTAAARALVDDQIFSWHQEAQGYKIRHVPAALPDMLKTEDMLRWEYSSHLGRRPDEAISASQARLDWMRTAQSDYEIALPLHEVESFARQTGYYAGLPGDIRAAQLDHIISVCGQLYPRLRLYLFDARKLYSAPITVFGPLLAVLYSGGHYLTFRDRERIETLTLHFDRLVREAEFTARDAPAFLARFSAQV